MIGQQPRTWFLPILAGALVAVASGAATIGPVSIPPGRVLASFAERAGLGRAELSTRDRSVLWDIRLPRIALAIVVGAGLGLAGAAMQGLFRNPLVDPGLIGVAGGAALGALSWIVLEQSGLATWNPAGRFALPLAAMAGALAATGSVCGIARTSGGSDLGGLLLAGIAVNAACGAGIGWLIFGASDDQLRRFTFWSLGSLSESSWAAVGIVSLFALPAGLALGAKASSLNVLLLGEAEALSLGVSPSAMRRLVVIGTAATVGAGVALCGAIGFIGLVVPHLVRIVAGPDHRIVLPGAAMLGGLLLVGADVVARTAVAPAEIPVGVVTAAFGAPFFVALLVRRRHQPA